jgi:Catechol dioxygenase N terminus
MSEMTSAQLLDKVLTDRTTGGNERVRSLVNRFTTDLYNAMLEFDVTPDEWTYPDITDTRGLHFQFAF